MQNIEQTDEQIDSELLSLELDLQREKRANWQYVNWVGETFVAAWPSLWSQIQRDTLRHGLTGHYANDSRAALLRQRLVSLNGELLPARAIELKSI